MARKRQIDPDIWTSEQVVTLPVEARILFIGLISHADDEGRLRGSPLSLKVSVFPADTYEIDQIKKWRDEIVAHKLAVYYEKDGSEYLWLPNFRKFQYMTKIFPSKLPAPPELITDNEQVNNELITESSHLYGIGIGIGNGIGIGVGDGNGSNNNKTLIDSLIKLPQWGKSNLKEDRGWLSEFLTDYPELSVEFIKACRDYHSNKKTHSKASWKNRLRNWIINERRYKEKDNHGRSNQTKDRKLPAKYTESTNS